MLVTGRDGVYQVDNSGVATQLIDGEVAFAVDDGRGGLLYQLDRGRNWDDEPAWSTVVRWIPAGVAAPRELLVPAPGSGHQLSLHDAYATGDGFAVVYTRHEGSIPDVDMEDRLRSYDVVTQATTDLFSVGGFESGIGWVSVDAGIVSLTAFGQVGGVCDFVDTSGNPVDVPGDPSEPECDEGCPMACVMSNDGDLMAYRAVWGEPRAFLEVTLIDAVLGVEQLQILVPHESARWWPRGLDLGEGAILLNRRGRSSFRPGLVIDLEAPGEPFAKLPIAGRGSFLKAPIAIQSPVRIVDDE